MDKVNSGLMGIRIYPQNSGNGSGVVGDQDC